MNVIYNKNENIISYQLKFRVMSSHDVPVVSSHGWEDGSLFTGRLLMVLPVVPLQLCAPSSSVLETSAPVAQIPLQGPTVSSSAQESSDEPQTVPVFEHSPTTTVTCVPAESIMAVPQR